MIKKPTLDITHPEIAAQIHPDSINKPNEVTARSNTKLLWQCPKGHVYERPASSITLGNGCKECRMNRGAPTVGVDDLATTHPDLCSASTRSGCLVNQKCVLDLRPGTCFAPQGRPGSEIWAQVPKMQAASNKRLGEKAPPNHGLCLSPVVCSRGPHIAIIRLIEYNYVLASSL